MNERGTFVVDQRQRTKGSVKVLVGITRWNFHGRWRSPEGEEFPDSDSRCKSDSWRGGAFRWWNRFLFKEGFPLGHRLPTDYVPSFPTRGSKLNHVETSWQIEVLRDVLTNSGDPPSGKHLVEEGNGSRRKKWRNDHVEGFRGGQLRRTLRDRVSDKGSLG